MDNRIEIFRNVLLSSAEATKSTGADLATLSLMLKTSGIHTDAEEVECECDYLIGKKLLAERKGIVSAKRIFVVTDAGRDHLDRIGLLN